MKKIFFLVITLTCLFSSFLVSDVFSNKTNNENTQFIANGTQINIRNNNQYISNSEQFFETIQKIAQQDSIEIFRVSYDAYNDLNNTTNIVYTTAKEDGAYSNSVKIRSGQFLNQNTDKDQFLSSKSSNDSNQIGVIEQFDGSKLTEIRPFMAQVELPLNFTCYLNTTDRDVAEKFVSDLKTQGINADGVNLMSENPNPVKSSFVILSVVFFFCIYALFIICLIYYLTSQYKQIAIKKLFGNTNNNIIKEIVFSVLRLFLISELINLVVITFTLGVYNSFSYYFKFIFEWILVQVTILILSIVITTLFSRIIKKVKPLNMLKNKKPLRSNQILNMVVKILFTIVVISISMVSFQNITYILSQNGNIDKWEYTKQLSNVYVSKTTSKHLPDGRPDPQNNYDYGTRMLNFFELTNNEGGIFISPNYKYTYPNESYIDIRIPDYSPNRKCVYVNNNYLIQNPIMDLSGNTVSFGDEYKFEINLLVPEKYKDNETDIIELYSKDLTDRFYYYDDNLYYYQNDIDKKTNPVAHNAIPIKITYVEDNQDYFTYNPNYCKDTNNLISDNPIAVVLNNKTFSKLNCVNNISAGDYMVKTDDMNNPTKSLEPIIQKTGTESDVIIKSLYKQVDKEMNDIKSEIAFQIMIILVAFTVLIMILLTTIVNYLEQNKNVNAVKCIHGHSFVNRHLSFFATLLGTWVAIFLGFSISCTVLNLSFTLSQLATVTTGLLLFETLILIPIIKIKEIKKTKDVLKGD